MIARLETYGKIRKHLVRIASRGAIPGPAPLPLLKNGLEAGMLTSMTEIPFGGEYLGLAILRNDIASPGERLEAGRTGLSVLVAGTGNGA